VSRVVCRPVTRKAFIRHPLLSRVRVYFL
jgi:hypothetical protein